MAKDKTQEGVPVKKVVWKINPDIFRAGYRAEIEGFVLLVNQRIANDAGMLDTTRRTQIFKKILDKGQTKHELVYEGGAEIRETDEFKPSDFFLYILGKAKVIELTKEEKIKLLEYERETYRND